MIPLFSVIIIYYNSEKYVHQSVKSVINQNFEDYELLLVNDGSTDCTKRICEDYAAMDKRIKVINKGNGGISDARNTGISHAKGEYVLLIDGDDYVAKGGLESFKNKIEESGHRADYIWGRMSCFYDRSGQIYKTQNNLTDDFVKGLNGRDAFVAMFQRNGHVSMGVRGAFRRQFLVENQIRFPDRYYEDVNVIMQVLLKANYVMINPYEYYFFRDRGDSTSKKYSLKYPREIIEEMKWWKENSIVYQKDIIFTECVRKEIDRRLKGMILKYARVLPLCEINKLSELINKHTAGMLDLSSVVWRLIVTKPGLKSIHFLRRLL